MPFHKNLFRDFLSQFDPTSHRFLCDSLLDEALCVYQSKQQFIHGNKYATNWMLINNYHGYVWSQLIWNLKLKRYEPCINNANPSRQVTMYKSKICIFSNSSEVNLLLC